VYQYLYFGYPVVSTGFPQVRRLTDYISVAETHEEFIKAITDAKSGKRISIMDPESISWSSKAKAMTDRFKEAYND
jgi:hypothetical protein